MICELSVKGRKRHKMRSFPKIKQSCRTVFTKQLSLVNSAVMNYLPKSNGKDNCLKSRFCLSCKNDEMSLRPFWHNTVDLMPNTSQITHVQLYITNNNDSSRDIVYDLLRVPTLLLLLLLLRKKSRTFPGLSRNPLKIFQDLFRARECLNIKKKTAFTYNIQSVVHCRKFSMKQNVT